MDISSRLTQAPQQDLDWAAPAASGGMTLIATATPSDATSVQFASIATTYKTLLLVWDSCRDPQEANGYLQLRLNNDSNAVYGFGGISKANT
ncbi:hypothetical protein BSN82_18040, partial [Acinetobacter baylyi]|uniref:hypothetical protein n=1 Tax=Acinetobacter baylyi TaxID=202950 RepID=UPI0013D3B1A4